MEKLPINLITQEILSRLDIQTLFAVSCVNKTLKSSVTSHLLPFISSLELPSSLLPDPNTLHHILFHFTNLRCLSLNSLRLQDSAIAVFLTHRLHHLNLSSCSLLSYSFLASIGQNSPFLRVLMLEMAYQGSPHLFNMYLVDMLSRCKLLECICIKIRGMDVNANAFQSIELFLPETINTLKLKPMLEENVISLVSKLGVGGNFRATEDLSIFVSPASSCSALQCLSLVLDVISDRLLVTITTSLPLLVELDLEDRPNREPSPDLELTNSGLQSLGSCHHLIDLSLIRSRKNYQGSFKRVNDMGMFLLAESCKDLQAVRLCGFSKVSDAGFASLLHSCQKLKKFEVRNALFLSDLAFHNLSGTVSALVEVRLLSCSLITSETVKQLSSSMSLEVLDLCGCKSVADSCVSSILSLQRLTSLNLSGSDITDGALSILGQGSLYISYLCLRGCKRITDKGILFLLCGGGAIARTLRALDLGNMPGLSDNGILTIVTAGKEITELCIRHCFYVTDSSIQALATKRNCQDGNKQLQRLDLFNCIGLSADSLKLLRKPFFSGLHWIGIGQTRLARGRGSTISEIRYERPWLTLCFDGCEMGCHDGWQFHIPESY